MSRLGFDMALDEQEHARTRSSSRGALFVVVVGMLAFALVVFLGVRTVMGSGPDYEGEGTGSALVAVHDGESLGQIAQALTEAGVVKTPQAFLDAAAADDRAASLPPGTYRLRLQMSAQAALATMLDPKSRASSRLVVPEGLRVKETVAAASKASGIPVSAFDAALAKPASFGLPAIARGDAEGFLFPATYDLPPKATATTILNQMTSRFRQAADDVDLVRGARDVGLTPLQVVTLASILEVESAPADYAKVARVVYNRLSIGKPLQLDSTVNYALGIKELDLTAAQLAFNSPYNTYLSKGLPPGPINSPGQHALEAALNPEPGNWLFFVTTDPAQQVTKFTASYQKFLEYKKEFRANLAAAKAAATTSAASAGSDG